MKGFVRKLMDFKIYCQHIIPTKVQFPFLLTFSLKTGNQAESISKTNENISVAISTQTGNQAESISKTNEINVSTEVYIEWKHI